ncbi:MAG: GNAT family N-acetyltransferase [Bacteroidetes bacterium]|nr:GNAT family N-acetyltransferase [Bacteroidota bacterium]
MIRDVKAEDIEHVCSLSDQFVGKNFQTYDSIKNYIADPKKILKVYKVNDEIIGFVKGKILKKSEFKKNLLKTDTHIEKELAGEGYMGFAETICVKKEYRGTRIASELANELIQSLKNLETIDVICTTVWKTSEGANAKKLVENIGFTYITEISDFWHRDSIDKNYICPKCGQPPCRCSMIFYRL